MDLVLLHRLQPHASRSIVDAALLLVFAVAAGHAVSPLRQALPRAIGRALGALGGLCRAVRSRGRPSSLELPHVREPPGASEALEALTAPEVADVLDVPTVPDVPTMPNVPTVPDVPEVVHARFEPVELPAELQRYRCFVGELVRGHTAAGRADELQAAIERGDVNMDTVGNMLAGLPFGGFSEPPPPVTMLVPATPHEAHESDWVLCHGERWT